MSGGTPHVWITSVEGKTTCVKSWLVLVRDHLAKSDDRDTGRLKKELARIMDIPSTTKVNQLITHFCDLGELARVCIGGRMYLYTREEVQVLGGGLEKSE